LFTAIPFQNPAIREINTKKKHDPPSLDQKQSMSSSSGSAPLGPRVSRVPLPFELEFIELSEKWLLGGKKVKQLRRAERNEKAAASKKGSSVAAASPAKKTKQPPAAKAKKQAPAAKKKAAPKKQAVAAKKSAAAARPKKKAAPKAKTLAKEKKKSAKKAAAPKKSAAAKKKAAAKRQTSTQVKEKAPASKKRKLQHLLQDEEDVDSDAAGRKSASSSSGEDDDDEDRHFILPAASAGPPAKRAQPKRSGTKLTLRALVQASQQSLSSNENDDDDQDGDDAAVVAATASSLQTPDQRARRAPSWAPIDFGALGRGNAAALELAFRSGLQFYRWCARPLTSMSNSNPGSPNTKTSNNDDDDDGKNSGAMQTAQPAGAAEWQSHDEDVSRELERLSVAFQFVAPGLLPVPQKIVTYRDDGTKVLRRVRPGPRPATLREERVLLPRDADTDTDEVGELFELQRVERDAPKTDAEVSQE
jgi:hypothetical protein